MTNLNEMIASGEICSCLRAKTMFYQVEGFESQEDSALAASQSYGHLWCVHTQSVLGPDGQVVDTETCRPGRGCCSTT